MSKRGLSFDEKKVRLLAYMQEHNSVYTLKELESSASKAKGIVSQTVKDVLMSLVADNLVEQDKIGAGNYFWSLPSKAKVAHISRIDQLTAEVSTFEAKSAELTKQLSALQAKKTKDPKSAERIAGLITQVNTLKNEITQLESQVAQYADSDPDKLKKLQEGVEISKAAANRWTDNLFLLVKAMRENRPEVEEDQIYENFNLPKNMDYI